MTFWRDTALRYVGPTNWPNDGRPFSARLRRITIPGAEIVEHASEAIGATRRADRCRRDGHDGICIDAMMSCSDAWMDQGGERRVARGTLCVLDFSRPLSVQRSRHRSVGLMLSRQRLREVFCEDEIDQLGGRRLASSAV